MPGPRDLEMLIEDVFAPQTERKGVPSFYSKGAGESNYPTPEEFDQLRPLLNPMDQKIWGMAATQKALSNPKTQQELRDLQLRIARTLDAVEGKDRTRPWAK